MEITQVEKDKLITLFVSFYGEQYKEYITKTINETIFMSVSNIQMKPAPKTNGTSPQIVTGKTAKDGFSSAMDLFAPKSKQNIEDPYSDIRETIKKIKVEQSIEKSNAEDKNVTDFYKSLAEKYPQLRDVELDFSTKFTLKKILRSCTSPDFYTSDMLSLFENLGINFKSLEELKQSDISTIISEHDISNTIEEIDKKYTAKIEEADIFYQESIKKFKSIPNIKQEALDVLLRDLKDFLILEDDAQAYFTTYLTNDNQMHTMVVLPENFNEHQLLHELNHALEAHFIKNAEDGYFFISGFDKLKVEYSETIQSNNVEKTHRKNEFLNESINECLYLRLLKKEKELGITITGNTEFHTGYGLGISLVDKFVSCYLEELKSCRLSNDPMQFKEIIGAENFDELSASLNTIMSQEIYEVAAILNSLEAKSGIKFDKGVASAVHNMGMLQQLENLTPKEQEYLKTIQRYQTISESLIASKQESLTT